MRRLFKVLRLTWGAAPGAMWRGAALSVAVLVMGVALLGLSGWFIVATGLAGLAGIGIAFDVFRPSAGIRFLALGRAASRYGERLLTHDATLRALAALRLDLMRRLAARPVAALQRLRGGPELTRITADVDALDGVVLRLALPLLAGLVTHAAAFAVLWWLVAPAVAGAVAAGYLLGAAAILARVAVVSRAPSAEAEAATQELRRGVIDAFRGQRDLLVQGRMGARLEELAALDGQARTAEDRLDRIDRASGFALAAVVAGVAGTALALGGWLVAGGAVEPAPAAIGFFVALALSETVLPLRKGLAEIGRMHDAAGRVMATEPAAPRLEGPAPAAAGLRGLTFEGVAVARPGGGVPLLAGLDLRVAPGETVALSGPSGSGKSTLLAVAAGLEAPAAGRVLLDGHPVGDWPEAALRARLTLVLQRAALVAGTIRDNLALAAPEADDTDMRAALEAVALWPVVAAKGGLDAVLGEGGAGLSGGEARRLALARAALRRPAVLLLDEPTEGLDGPRAEEALRGLRAMLPEAAILTASHRAEELATAHRTLDLGTYISKTASV
ncbi:amino acid ABC transporter ATP-binding/permease protein [Rhodosalinus sp.]|uniref:amino acid ABC transporter ATP-binding/permease protein n=1 Tax=Rhodosalinus sp. TaxID=2047741 RepID=UPI0035613D4D